MLVFRRAILFDAFPSLQAIVETQRARIDIADAEAALLSQQAALTAREAQLQAALQAAGEAKVAALAAMAAAEQRAMEVRRMAIDWGLLVVNACMVVLVLGHHLPWHLKKSPKRVVGPLDAYLWICIIMCKLDAGPSCQRP